MVEAMDERQVIESRLGAALLRVIRNGEASWDAAARQQSMHPTDLRCLRYLDERGEPLSVSEITAHLSLTSGAGTALLDRLEKAGLITRERHPADRRGVRVSLNTEAAANSLAVFRHIQSQYHAATLEFSTEQLGAIADFLERLQQLSDVLHHDLQNDQSLDRSKPQQ